VRWAGQADISAAAGEGNAVKRAAKGVGVVEVGAARLDAVDADLQRRSRRADHGRVVGNNAVESGAGVDAVEHTPFGLGRQEGAAVLADRSEAVQSDCLGDAREQLGGLRLGERQVDSPDAESPWSRAGAIHLAGTDGEDIWRQLYDAREIRDGRWKGNEHGPGAGSRINLPHLGHVDTRNQ